VSARFRLRHHDEEIDVEGPIVVGRAAACRVRVDDRLVSRQHARFTMSEGALVVEDLESRNGVLVNERKITAPTALGHGDVVSIGLQSFEVIDAEATDANDALSTMPPPVPRGEGDTDVVQVTVTANLDHLTEREREVLQLVVLGHTQKEMAAQLHVSVKTIETHRTRLAQKLGCRTRAELVSYAISAGVLRRM